MSNASKSDPAEWLAVVARPMQGSSYRVRCAKPGDVTDITLTGSWLKGPGLRVPVLAATPAWGS